MKIGVTDAGGGFRGVYGCAVLDSCLENGIHFDYAIGVSAGSANLISYLAGQRERNYRFYTDYGFRKQYASFGQFCPQAQLCGHGLCLRHPVQHRRRGSAGL